MGKARCSSFGARLQGTSENTNAGPLAPVDFIESLQQLCSGSGSGTTLAHLDLVTPATFDNQYYVNLVSGEGLLPSDQVLVTGNDQTRKIVEDYAEDLFSFFEDFKNSMIKMGNIGLGTGTGGEIRRNCRTIN